MMLEGFHLPSFESAKLLVYGDVMLDRYWYGNTSRISPEAPVPVVLVDDTEARPGGAANVALNTVALGVKTTLFGLTGEDAEADLLRKALDEKNIQCHFQTISGYPTIAKLRVLGRNQQLIRMDFEKGFFGVDDVELIQRYEAHLDSADIVVLSDYAKGALQHVDHLIALARKKGLPVLVDPKSNDFSKYAGATLITPNRKEFEAVVGQCHSNAEIKEKAVALLKELDIEALLVTLGKDGMLLVQQHNEPLYLPTRAQEVFDVTGAGDTVIAVLGAAIASGQSLEQAAQLANMAAGVVVGKLGAATVSVPELRRALQRECRSDLGVLTEEELLLAVSDARAHGETVVMTNGCFDILHAGHVQYLDSAKKLGDRLIVAINDDDSVRRLKGSARPFNSLKNRMDVMSALRVVDWVVSFSEDTPARLIEAVLPDVLVKGGDYRPEDIAGGEAVKANGGEVAVLDLVPGVSTTGLAEKIKTVSEETV
ncbi:MAG: bifunctional D-glycero-beta-D-manno-heptose-7-phosphate kinase/D-glycero-beta-D-manno-heptose 1-phosphate adenylyltransferase HldE [Coxiellaceae bacterium]|nr:bifunctional D-glycero-beta-D-manno-heptose-7-phosphate kinase/D-glycero-beta-D-manno-heptose 1-phosphate adenylyltransferase HldE [Coxiellaceae bacterium]